MPPDSHPVRSGSNSPSGGSSPPPAPRHDDEVISLPRAPKVRAGTLVMLGAAGVGLLLVLFVVGFLPRLRRERALAEEAQQGASALPRVNVVTPKRRAAGSDLTLPGTIQPLLETVVFARTSGYVKRRYVDIGDHVAQGQLLLELETPEIAQELMQAQATLAQSRASLEQAKTNLALARTSLDRTKAMTPQGIASQQELDERAAAYNAADAGVKAAEAAIQSNEANVRRLTELQSFARVTAPFAGTVTSRTVEVGALVMAGNGAGQALYKVAQVNPVRVMVNVPQAYAPLVRAGDAAKATVREHADRVFAGKVTRTAGALDPVSRTMLTEVQIPNDDGALLAGMYAQVQFAVSEAQPPLILPTSALILTAEGTQVALVDTAHRVHMHKVVVGGDYGNEIGVVSGLNGDEQVISNPGERLSEGVEVTLMAPVAGAAAH